MRTAPAPPRASRSAPSRRRRCSSRTPARRWSASKLDDAALDALADAVRAACQPINDKRGTAEYRTKIVGVLAQRAAAVDRARARAASELRHEQASTSPPRSTASRPSSSASRRRACSTCCATSCGLTGSKEGCNNGNCGACTVILDGRLVNSCLVLARRGRGRARSTTIEGIAEGGELHPAAAEVPRARGAAVRHLHAGLHRRGEGAARRATRTRPRHEIRYWLAGNLCRCTGYDKIVRAVHGRRRPRCGR